MRIFLDTCTFQFIHDYGGYVFESNCSVVDESIQEYPNGERNLKALHDIMEIDSAGAPSISFVLSESSEEEIRSRGEPGYTSYAYNVLDS